MERRRDIEGLRALAVLAVLLFHAKVSGISGGYVGVDVFFVISGFLITSLLLAECGGTGRLALRAFYARRVRRILPVSSVVALCTLLASWVWLEPIRLPSLSTDVLGVATFSSNLVFGGRGADYLQSSLPPSPLQHYWSLAVEEQFYVVWPLLVALVTWKVASRAGAARRIGVLAALVAAASFAACMFTMNTSQPWAFFAPHTRAFELAVGALLAALPAPRRDADRGAANVLAWAGLAVIVWSIVTFDDTTRFPGPWALVPVLGTAFLIRGGQVSPLAPVAVLRASPLQWLGSRSYSAYLWHWPVLIVGAAAVGRDLTVVEALVCVAVSLVLSEASYRFVEDPIRRDTGIRGLRALALAVSLLAVVAGAGLLARNNPPSIAGAGIAGAPVLETSTTTTLPTDATSSTVATTPQIPAAGAPIRAVVDAESTTGLPADLTPSLTRVYNNQPVIYANKCHIDFTPTTPKHCVFGDKSSSVVVGLYGDSHAAEWFPALEKIAIKRHWKLITYTKKGCPPANITVYNNVIGRVYTQCAPWREKVLKKMVQDRVKVVFVAHFDRSLSAATRKPMWQKEWRDALTETMSGLRDRGITPVLMEDTPFPGQDIPSCLSRNYTDVPRCAFGPTSGIRADMTELRTDLDNSGEHVVWVRQWFCTDTYCPPIVGNILVYRDNNHMTVEYARFIAPLLDEAVGPVVDWYSRTG